MKNIIRITLAIIAAVIVTNDAISQDDSLVVRVRDIDIVMVKVETAASAQERIRCWKSATVAASPPTKRTCTSGCGWYWMYETTQCGSPTYHRGRAVIH